MDDTLMDYKLVFGVAPDGLNKRERLEFGESLMTHAMVFTGFDRDADDNVCRLVFCCYLLFLVLLSFLVLALVSMHFFVAVNQ